MPILNEHTMMRKRATKEKPKNFISEESGMDQYDSLLGCFSLGPQPNDVSGKGVEWWGVHRSCEKRIWALLPEISGEEGEWNLHVHLLRGSLTH